VTINYQQTITGASRQEHSLLGLVWVHPCRASVKLLKLGVRTTGDLFWGMVRLGYRFSAFSYAKPFGVILGLLESKRQTHFELKIKASGGNNFIEFPENQLTNFLINVRPTNITSSRLGDIGSSSTVSFGRDVKHFQFLFSRWCFLDDSGGNKTLRKWEGSGRKIRVLTDHKLTNSLKQAFTVNRVLKRMSEMLSLK